MLKAQLDLSVPCPHTQDFEPCMGPGCSDEGGYPTKNHHAIYACELMKCFKPSVPHYYNTDLFTSYAMFQL